MLLTYKSLMNSHCFSLKGKDVISRHLEKAVELTVGAMLDVPAVLNGQVFDSIT